jgi:AraC-like DNA-binding protein
MVARYGTRLSIAALAKAAGLGISQFHTVLRHEAGKTPGEMLRDVRLGKACIRLQETNLPIAEIALAVGFSDQTAFKRHLRRFRATTPTLCGGAAQFQLSSIDLREIEKQPMVEYGR